MKRPAAVALVLLVGSCGGYVDPAWETNRFKTVQPTLEDVSIERTKTDGSVLYRVPCEVPRSLRDRCDAVAAAFCEGKEKTLDRVTWLNTRDATVRGTVAGYTIIHPYRIGTHATFNCAD